jgi:hypothetical protein
MTRDRMTMRLLPVLALLLGACGFTPTLIFYESRLTASSVGDEPESRLVREGATATYSIEGLRVRVEPMTDTGLNALFPEDSERGFFATNPYTYGNWIDPHLGYTPNRFTVFRVTVINDIYAKVLLDPLKPELYTGRGEVHHSYGIPSFSPHQSFERYYRAIRGQSGNEFYRFDLRMGNVRSTAYLQGQMVFKGESYSGFLIFDPLEEEVEEVELVLKDFVLKFDASGQPLEAVDVAIRFDRHIAKDEKAQIADATSDGGE